MVTPEATYPLSPADPKPLPYMPKEFLQPTTPQPAAAPRQKPIASANAKPAVEAQSRSAK
jgi:hypothetical protein